MVEIGLSTQEKLEQSNCFVFQNGEVITYNDEIASRVKSCLPITGAINAKKMLDMLSKSNDDFIEFEFEKGKLFFRGKKKRGFFKIETKILLPTKDVETPKKWKKLPSDFILAIGLVAECSKSIADSIRLACVHFTSKLIEACDGVQAGRYEISIPFDKDILLKGETVKRIAKLKIQEVSITDNWIHFRNEIGLLLSCIIYVDKYPSDRLTEIFRVKGKPSTLPNKLKELTERVRVFLDDDMSTQWLKVELTPTYIQVTGEGKYGKQTERQKIKYEGEPIEFSINPELLRILVEKHDCCRVSSKVIKIEKGKFQYVTSLWIPNVKIEEKT